MTRPKTADPQIVEILDVPTQGAATALINRVQQLQATLTLGNQCLSTLRNASLASTHFYGNAAGHLRSDIYPYLFPPRPDCQADGCDPNPSSSLRSVIDELAKSESATAARIHNLWESEKSPSPFCNIAQQINLQRQNINELLAQDRLGKAHQRNEAKLVVKAAEINASLGQLRMACLRYLAPEPQVDPYFLTQTIRQSMDTFEDIEYQYTRRCIYEGEAIRKLERGVFHALQEIPPAHQRMISEIMNDSNMSLTAVRTVAKTVDSNAGWNTFEYIYKDELPEEEMLKITADNHPNEDQFLQFQRLHLTTLQVQHRVTECAKGQKLSGMRRLKNRLFGSKIHYGTPGTVWSISDAGHLIQYHPGESRIVRVYNLRKCNVSELEYDADWGYFILEGLKMSLSDRGKIKGGTKKKYKFRLPEDDALFFHNMLKEFCVVMKCK